MVVNGREQFNGSNRAQLKVALRNEEAMPIPLDLRILSSTREGDLLNITFSAAGVAGQPMGDLFIVLTDDLDQSSVLRGENSGRSLAHVAVARSITRVAGLHATTGQIARVQLPPGFRNFAGHHLVLFAQQSHSGPVLGIDFAAL